MNDHTAAATHDLTAAAIERAAVRLRDVVRETPLDGSPRLSDRADAPVFLKREDLQVCRSYKVRGAYNFMASLDRGERARGVVCASAGNHGQGLAFACRALEIHGRVYVPSNTPRQKRVRIAEIGGPWVELMIAGSSYDAASAAAIADSEQRGAVYVHPFDDPRTIAGQGTIALELATQLDGPIDTIVAPVGGGGLIAGIALWVRANLPEVRIVGVEPAGAASMRAALDAGRPVKLDSIDTFVDGAAVGLVGATPFPIVRDLVDEVCAVPEGAVCTEMLELYQTEGIIAEPAGALASTAVFTGVVQARGPIVAIVSGGNNDVSRYADVVERSLLHEGLRHYFLVSFPQEPGALRRFLDEVLSDSEDIVLFEYVKKNNRETGPALVGIELESPEGLPGLLARMDASPIEIERVPPGSPLFSFML